MIELQKTTFETLNIDHNGEWCNVMWRQVGGSGGRYRMIILSSYGNWSYYWVTGSSSFPAWLAGLNFEYLGHKLFEGGFYTFDKEATGNNIISELLEARRRNEIDAFDSRELFDSLKSGDFDEHLFWSMDLSFIESREHDILVTSPCSTWKHFWKYLWEPVVIPALLEVAESEQNAA